jgi:hypothetical protein
MSKCPYCDTPIRQVKFSSVTINAGTKSLRGNAYSCPSLSCGKIISIEMDPIALNSDLVDDIKRSPR